MGFTYYRLTLLPFFFVALYTAEFVSLLCKLNWILIGQELHKFFFWVYLHERGESSGPAAVQRVAIVGSCT